MNLLMINVSLRPHSPSKFIPVGLAYVATSVTRAGFELDIIDLDINPISRDDLKTAISKKKYDVALMGCLITGYRQIKGLSSLIKEVHPECLIIVGNSVASSIPEILLKNTLVDVAVIGEGEVTAVELLTRLKKGGGILGIDGIVYREGDKLRKTKLREAIKDIDTIPIPDWDLFDVEGYIKSMRHMIPHPLPEPIENLRPFPISSSRGCIAQCTFCYHQFIEYKFRFKSPKATVDEMEYIQHEYNVNYFNFWDDLCFYSKRQIGTFLELLTERGLKVYWGGSCRADLFKRKDFKLLKDMKNLGCIRLGYALESANPEILMAMEKHITLDSYREQTEVVKKAGIPVTSSIVIGYPQETPETIANTFRFCIEVGVYPSMGYLLPQPKTVMYEYAKKNGFITDDEEYIFEMGDRQDLILNMTKMSDDELPKTVSYWAQKLNEELGLGLSEDHLIKTGHRISR